MIDALKRGIFVSPELMQLSRIICNRCVEKDYEKCTTCKVYVLINKIAAS